MNSRSASNALSAPPQANRTIESSDWSCRRACRASQTSLVSAVRHHGQADIKCSFTVRSGCCTKPAVETVAWVLMLEELPSCLPDGCLPSCLPDGCLPNECASAANS